MICFNAKKWERWKELIKYALSYYHIWNTFTDGQALNMGYIL